jgi:DNA polymerase III alpha subunit
MRTDKFGQQILTETDICELYLKDPEFKLSTALVESNISFNPELELSDAPKIHEYMELDCSIEEFDSAMQQMWFVPKEYQDFDIAQYVLDKCKNEAELQRAGDELLKFQERNMFPLLQYLKYLVDTMRANKVVWGVGRGSSVASFVLYLLGVHRINSLYYDLSIDEFLK